eukprot:TRINITY_DN22608_c0_g2_i1.p1 TRINITY_DN22608_c0_g2~~TRINITY_DN22608_c0_g2_i1.p1  ORF type:complete len:523 (+),score=71.85 TRINITY_DN22608_c0_g2_i1:46-1614(+)
MSSKIGLSWKEWAEKHRRRKKPQLTTLQDGAAFFAGKRVSCPTLQDGAAFFAGKRTSCASFVDRIAVQLRAVEDERLFARGRKGKGFKGAGKAKDRGGKGSGMIAAGAADAAEAFVSTEGDASGYSAEVAEEDSDLGIEDDIFFEHGEERDAGESGERDEDEVAMASDAQQLSDSEDESWAEAQQKLQGDYAEAWEAHHKVHPAHWAVNSADLRELNALVRLKHSGGEIPEDPTHPDPYHNDKRIGPSVYSVVKHLLVPETKRLGCRSWALTKHPHGLRCARRGGDKSLTFVSHGWSEGIFEFMEHVEAYVRQDSNFWICFLANPQAWLREDLSTLLGMKPARSPFARALTYADSVYVVPNQKESVYCRLWCVFEIYLSMELGLSGEVGYTNADVLVIKLPRGVDCNPDGSGVHDYLATLAGVSIREAVWKRVIVKLNRAAYARNDRISDYADTGQRISKFGWTFVVLVKKGGKNLAKTKFTTVRDAKCSSETDRVHIWDIIEDSVRDIDEAILQLCEIGRF